MDGSAAPRAASGAGLAGPWLGLVVALLCPMGCEGEPPPAPLEVLEAGRGHFESYCEACHRADGRGNDEGVPPLLESPWLRGPESRVIRILLHGLHGPIEVGGEIYDLEMLAFGDLLTDADIAAVVSFVRKRYADVDREIPPEEVARVRAATADRAEYWTAEELLEVR